jgi:dTDP-glucose 4,6-dehydratase
MADTRGHSEAGWSGRRVAVTGAGGFIGSHLVERLVALGATVRAGVRYNSRNDWGWLDHMDSSVRSEVECMPGDIADLAHVSRLVSGCQVVMHLGAQISIPKSYEDPGIFVASNLTGTFNVLTACRGTDVERVVHTSTSEVYGSALKVPMDESHPLQAQSPYSATKIGADKLVESFYRSFALPAVIVRPFNTFGPRQSTRAVIPTVISQALWSDRIKIGSTDPIRDFNYVANTVDGFVLAACVPGVEGGVFNIGSGRETSVADMIAIAMRMVGRDLPVITEQSRARPEKSEVSRLLADYGSARKSLGYEPKISFEDGLARTIEWTRLNREQFKVGEYAV